MTFESTPGFDHDISVTIPLHGNRRLESDLILPARPFGVVVFAHGAGSNRRSPRNRHLARLLRDLGFATMLIDLLTADEQADGQVTGNWGEDAAEAAERIVASVERLRDEECASDLPIGLLGAGTGAASALVAAATRPEVARAVVARSGRTELADAHLARVNVPTLLIAGSHDLPVVHRNRLALERLGSEQKKLEIVPGASHLFEEPGALSAAAIHAANWFAKHLAGIDSATVAANNIGRRV